MKNERLIWILGIVGAVGAAAGITYAATKSSTTPQNPNPPNPPNPPKPPPGAATWVPANQVLPNRQYRISIPGDPVTTALITKMLVNANVGKIYLQGGTPLPTDWPKDDNPDPTRWRAEFTSPVALPVPPFADVKLWVLQPGM